VARDLGLKLPVVEARSRAELEAAFAVMARERAEAIMVLTDVMFITERRAIVDLAARRRLPAVYFDRQFVDAGGLMFYGASLVHMYRRAAVYVDKILKGARPADLPIEQPTTFELVVNLKTARILGLKIPPAFLLRADQVIE
jgi:putative ABC transport system substrate-binding protein